MHPMHPMHPIGTKVEAYRFHDGAIVGRFPGIIVDATPNGAYLIEFPDGTRQGAFHSEIVRTTVTY